ncbi:MAG: hypothetical protein IPP71_12415 [Bacteroidetes bacterium]|nr:hypothetical protein [Bacteroidota bacterium]
MHLKKAMELSPHQLQFILDGIVLSSMKKRVRYEHHFVDKKSMVASVSALI